MTTGGKIKVDFTVDLIKSETILHPEFCCQVKCCLYGCLDLKYFVKSESQTNGLHGKIGGSALPEVVPKFEPTRPLYLRGDI